MSETEEWTRPWVWTRGLGCIFIFMGVIATWVLVAPGISALVRLGVTGDSQKAWETGAAISPALSAVGALLMGVTAIMSVPVTTRLNRAERKDPTKRLNRKPVFWVFAMVVAAQAGALIVQNVLEW